MATNEEEVDPAEEYRLGARVYMAMGAAFAVGYVFTADGPWRWLEVSIAVVCLVRAGWYMWKSRSV